MNMQIHLRLVLVVFIAGLMMIVGCAEKIRHHQRCRTGTANHPGTDAPSQEDMSSKDITGSQIASEEKSVDLEKMARAQSLSTISILISTVPVFARMLVRLSGKMPTIS